MLIESFLKRIASRLTKRLAGSFYDLGDSGRFTV